MDPTASGKSSLICSSIRILPYEIFGKIMWTLEIGTDVEVKKWAPRQESLHHSIYLPEVINNTNKDNKKALACRV